MSNEKKITLNYDLGQIANDVLVKCNLISKSIKEEAMSDIAASVQTPDSPETVSIINRSLTEAFGNVKRACQRYLKTGRSTDNNMLEQMVSNVTYIIGERQVIDDNGHPVFEAIVSNEIVDVYKVEEEETIKWMSEDDDTEITPDTGTTPQPKMEEYDTDDIDTITYETITLELFIPNFNVSVTDALKSSIHKYVVDYIMGRFLQDQVTDKAGEYAGLADGKDMQDIGKNLTARDKFTARKPSWI